MIFHHKTRIAAGLFVALLLPCVSQASIIFSNLGAGSSYNINTGNLVGNDLSGDNDAEADRFTPSSTAKLGSLKIALSNSFTSPSAYTVSLRSNNADQPGAVLESFTGSGRAALGLLGTDNPLVTFTSILQPTLTSGTIYWLTVSTTPSNFIVWNFNSTSDTSDEAISTDTGATWFSPSGLAPGAYEVDSAAVPEPSTIWPLAGVLSLLLFSRNRRRPVNPH